MLRLNRGVANGRVGWKWAAAALALLACSNNAQQSSNPGTAGSSTKCAQGDTRSCLGPGACSGAQSCSASEIWSACDCGESGKGGSVGQGADAGRDGRGGTGVGGNGGTADASGDSGTTQDAGSGGTTQDAGSGGTTQDAGDGGTTQDAGRGGGGGGGCTPTVLLLIDASSSMFGPPAPPWATVQSALLDPVSGVLAARQNQVRFGFASYRSISAPTFDSQCPRLSFVNYAIGNYNPINTAFSATGAGYSGLELWKTPTGESITAASAALAAYVPPTPSPKYIVLLTDGNPDTCAVRNPQCGQDSSIAAAQYAFGLGIRLFAIGVGDILADNSGCSGRCGVQHLQDMANAGSGQPVAANSSEYPYQPCVGGVQNLKGIYAASGAPSGTAPYYTAQTSDQLHAALDTVVNAIVTCQ